MFRPILRTVLFSAFLLGGLATAEEKTCVVSGVHCKDCAETVQNKVCEPGKYSACEVKVTNAKKELGQVHLVTKDAKSKIDEKVLGSQVKDAGDYTLEKCSTAKGDKAS